LKFNARDMNLRIKIKIDEMNANPKLLTVGIKTKSPKIKT